MNNIDCIISSSYHYYKCLDVLNNITKENDKYKFNSISNIFTQHQPNNILLVHTIVSYFDYVLASVDHPNVYKTVIIIEKLAETKKEKEILEKLSINSNVIIHYNEPNNSDFYNEEFFKSVIDKLIDINQNN